ncbi:amidohydrolase [Salinicola avicenniae]|uniref:amidohydrolase n=1 Tax=Salinicola avicenniae TaxID=2916836 RepID=UPI00207454D4|nr:MULTISPECIES: amidohydrolase [unclassified Salinicola]
MNDLRITLLQSDLIWESPAANREALDRLMGTLDGGQTDLIVLPEMFATGFSMDAERLAESPNGTTVEWLQRQARERQCAITGSLAITDRGDCFNRLIWAPPEGEAQHYDKHHLFRMGAEPAYYTAGTARQLVEYRGVRFLLSVCYDLRFPVWLRQQPVPPNTFEYDVLLCVANWPAPRRHAWRTLLQARAIENLAYVVGVNRVGQDGNGLDYAGDSLLVDFKGVPLVDHAAGQAFVETASISPQSLAAFRDKFPAWQDADRFSLGV